jgi:hypothetical protein
MWLGSLILNHYFNDGHFWKALALLVPNLIGAGIATGILTLPIRKAVRKMNTGIEQEKSFVGMPCVIISSEATSDFGQAEIATCGAPLTINVRTAPGEVLRRGEEGRILKDPANGIYLITKATNPVTQEKVC